MSDAPFSGRRSPASRPGPARGGRPFVAALLVVVLAPLASGCATKGDVRDLRADVQELSEQQESLLRTLAELQRATLDSLAVQSDALFSLRGELSRQVLDIQEQLVTIQELTGQSQRSLAGLRDQIEARRTQIVELEQVDGAPGADDGAAEDRPDEPDAEPADTVDEAMPGVEPGGSAEELYNVAIRQFNRGSITTARRAFERFLQAHPNHRLAPDAHLKLADILVQENRLEDAVDAFLEIPELFPSAGVVPDALYRAAGLQIELGREEEARELLERVVNSYPDSGAAILAEERLDELP